MSVSSLLLPVFVQVGLTFLVLLRLAMLRQMAFRAGLNPQDVAMREPNFPPSAVQASHCYQNELELPMLFYVLAALILVTSTNSFVFVLLAWVFVLTRIVRAYVHLTVNIVRVRGPVFGLGLVVLIAMWVIFAARILVSGA